jgi:hypothetical protein|tara:strand:+ start:102 stop:416 length:315 start_codon:yes stop_codon:yes gene_type:complete
VKKRHKVKLVYKQGAMPIIKFRAENADFDEVGAESVKLNGRAHWKAADIADFLRTKLKPKDDVAADDAGEVGGSGSEDGGKKKGSKKTKGSKKKPSKKHDATEL